MIQGMAYPLHNCHPKEEVVGFIASIKLPTWMFAAVVFAALSLSPAASKPRDTAELCERATARQESSRRIPRKLLYAISIAETGRWDKVRQENTAWPWTVTSGGKGRYFPTKQAAIRAARELKRQGRRNIDVGCMQINLKYHPKAFKSLDDAFDPAKNTAYAAKFLVKLRQDKRSWVQAVKHYHSATRALHNPYRAKVYKIWRTERWKARNTQITQERSLRKRNATRFARAQKLLANDRLSSRRQNWLDKKTRAIFQK
jgi:hypothetical protein